MVNTVLGSCGFRLSEVRAEERPDEDEAHSTTTIALASKIQLDCQNKTPLRVRTGVVVKSTGETPVSNNRGIPRITGYT